MSGKSAVKERTNEFQKMRMAGSPALQFTGSGEGEGKNKKGALVSPLALSGDVAAMLASDGADKKEAETSALDTNGVAPGYAVEAVEDALELVFGDAEALIGDGKGYVVVAGDGERDGDVEVVGAVLDGVVEEIEDGGAKVFGDGVDAEFDLAGDGRKGDGFRRKVMTGKRDGDALGDERLELEQGALLLAGALAELAGLEDLLDGGQETIGVGAHDGVKLAALVFVDGSALEGLEIKTDACYWGFKLVGDGVEEGVLALVATNFADEKDGVEDETGDDDHTEDGAQDVVGETDFVGKDPGDVERDGEAAEQRAEGDEGSDGSAAAIEVHAACRIQEARREHG